MLTSVYLHWTTKIVWPTLITCFYQYSNFSMNTDKLSFFDGGYPFCKREVDFLQSGNKEEKIKFIDNNISDLCLDQWKWNYI